MTFDALHIHERKNEEKGRFDFCSGHFYSSVATLTQCLKGGNARSAFKLQTLFLEHGERSFILAVQRIHAV